MTNKNKDITLYYVYELYNEHEQLIYVGYTNNLNRRFLEHTRNAANKNYKNMLYKMCRANKWTICEMKPIKCFIKMSSAKLYEAYTIAKQLIEYSNPHLCNGQLDKTRIFINTYIKEQQVEPPPTLYAKDLKCRNKRK